MGDQRCFIKWAPAVNRGTLDDEAARLAWATAFVRVPRVIDRGTDAEGSWIMSLGLPGDNAVSDRWKAEPLTAVVAIGRGLRAFHDSLPVAGCPFSWSAVERVANTRRGAAAGMLKPSDWHQVHRDLSVESALTLLEDTPPIDRLVVCHGDACAPNTLLTAEGDWLGHVDLGSLGVADRWADLAIATWSTQWNYGPGFEEPLLAAYGVVPDPERTRYYRLLWDLDL